MYDFSSPVLAESIYHFLFVNDLLTAPRAFNMSMLEFVTLVCPDEFADFLKSCGFPDSCFVK